MVADLVDRPALDAAVRSVDLIIHTASIRPARQADARILATNVTGAWNLWAVAASCDLPAAVLGGEGKVWLATMAKSMPPEHQHVPRHSGE